MPTVVTEVMVLVLVQKAGKRMHPAELSSCQKQSVRKRDGKVAGSSKLPLSHPVRQARRSPRQQNTRSLNAFR